MDPMVRGLSATFILTALIIGIGRSDSKENHGMQKENPTFWNMFGEDYRKNCLAWRHSPHNPVIPVSGNTWKTIYTANPDVLEFNGKTLLYYRGQGVMPGTDGRGHDRIAVAEILEISPENISIRDLNEGVFVVDVGEPGSFDDGHVLDPAAVVFNESVLLYYSAVGSGADSVGLAQSPDGIRFEKIGKVLTGRAPDVIVRDGMVFMIYQKKNEHGTYRLYLARSEDGVAFTDVVDEPVFVPADKGWDRHDVVTARMLQEGEWYYILYGGSSYTVDQPDYFGLARSRDLVHWERHPGNPIFGCGPKGSEDGGAIWFPALIELDSHYVLLYEGSRGKYHSGDLSSQICMASLEKKGQGGEGGRR